MKRRLLKSLGIALMTAGWILPIDVVAVTADPPAEGPLRPEILHLAEIKDFPVSIPGARARSLFRTESADMFLTRREPGTKLHRHLKSDHFVYILKGKGEVRIGARREAVASGDLVLIPKGEEHSILKDGPGDFLFLAFSTPPMDSKDFAWLEE